MKNLQHKYYESYKDNKLLFPGLDITWLKELREEAIAQFKKDGFPDKSVEEWNNHSYKNLKEKYFTPFSDNKFTTSKSKRILIFLLVNLFFNIAN